MGIEAVCKLGAVVGLDTFDFVREALDTVANKFRRSVCIMLFECLQIAETAVLVQEGVLVVVTAIFFRFFSCSADQAGGGDIFHIDLHLLPGIERILIRFRLVFGIWQFFCHLPAFLQKAVQPGDRPAVAALPQLDPEYHQSGVRVSPAHILDEPDFLRPVLVWMAVGPMGTVLQGLQRTVVTLLPSIDVLPVCVIPYRRFGNPIFLCILN